MRFVHIADTHLGMIPDKGRPWSDRRGRELMDSFAAIIAYCAKTHPDLLLIAGDLFHKQPLLKELKTVNHEFSLIPGTKVVIIAGNHDYISGNSFYRRFEWCENVSFIASSDITRIYFEDINTEIYGCSYLNRDFHEAAFEDLRPEHPDRINILLAHGGEPGNLPIDWKELARAGFDYVALGHIHKPIDKAENIRYPGSLEPLDKNETGAHGFIEGEISDPAGRQALSMAEAEVPAGIDTSDIWKMEPDISDILKMTTSSGKTVISRRILCSIRRYIKAQITVTAEDTGLSLRKRIAALINENGPQNIYVLELSGERSPDISFDGADFDDLGNISEIVDTTLPKLDFERLAVENADNVIGHFIKSMQSAEGKDPVREKALYYGVMALTGR